MRRTVIIVSLVIAVVAAAALYLSGGGPAPRPMSPMAQAIKDRQTNFKTMGAIMKMVDDQTKSDDPDQKKIAEGVHRLAVLGAQIPDWFPPGSGHEAGVKTNAKPDIWTDNANFLQKQQDFMAEAKKLDSVATSGTVPEITSQYYTTGVACANCHKPFREKID